MQFSKMRLNLELTAKTNSAVLFLEVEKRLHEFTVIRRVHELPNTCCVIEQRALLPHGLPLPYNCIAKTVHKM